MQHQVRSEDRVGRLGGGEFIIILPGPSLDTSVLRVMERILRTVGEPIEIEGGDRVNVRPASDAAGIPSAVAAEALMNRSDMAMYRVKGNGGNAFVLFRADTLKDEEKTTG